MQVKEIIICGPNIDRNRLEYIYWEFRKIYPRRWAPRKCHFCKGKVLPKDAYLVKAVPNKEYLQELDRKSDMITLIHFYEATPYPVCPRCLQKLEPKREGRYDSKD